MSSVLLIIPFPPCLYHLVKATSTTTSDKASQSNSCYIGNLKNFTETELDDKQYCHDNETMELIKQQTFDLKGLTDQQLNDIYTALDGHDFINEKNVTNKNELLNLIDEINEK